MWVLGWFAGGIVEQFVSFETGTKGVSFMALPAQAVLPYSFPSRLLSRLPQLWLYSRTLHLLTYQSTEEVQNTPPPPPWTVLHISSPICCTTQVPVTTALECMWEAAATRHWLHKPTQTVLLPNIQPLQPDSLASELGLGRNSCSEAWINKSGC